MQRVGVVLHPTRPVLEALEVLERWAKSNGVELVQVQDADQSGVVPTEEIGDCNLIVALGGDGTVLTALHAAARTKTPVLGVACGTLGALSSVSAAEMEGGLGTFAAGERGPRSLAALVLAMY